MPLVTMIEDDPAISESLRSALSERGHTVRAASTALAGLALVTETPGDAIVLDLGLPDLDGRAVIKMLRALTRAPIIVATARDSEDEIVRALDSGADEYIVKPFSGAQLDARIRALMRRIGEEQTSHTIVVGGLEIEPRGRQARLDGRHLELTRIEFDILHYLAARVGSVIPRRELLTEIWRQPYSGSEGTVDVHLSWLRRKLGETASRPRYLRVVRGVGAQLVDPSA
ncbi:MAG TPA: response regulator transcription factor [Candidatus Dormibacteraeota bacterium]|nr:response regulator transcription factor [Candidatus Dormibacteraeota bacterium]